MKGIIFNLLEEVVTEELGEEAWEQLLEDSLINTTPSPLHTLSSRMPSH
jgi:hypothetical protein